jgi:N-dimethylarginine dimethylaminohydrolase
MLMSTQPFSLNHRVLVSDARYLEPKGINALENPDNQPNREAAQAEHQAATAAFKEAGIQVEQIASPVDCQDGVFTANWGLTWNGRALLSNLPNLRKAEEPTAETTLQALGFQTRPSSLLFSGQGDAMIIGDDRVLIGNGYRTNPAVASEIRDWLGLEPVVVRAKPKRRFFGFGPAVRNSITGLWDSYYYDLDLAVAVIQPYLLAVCFDALTHEGRRAIERLRDVEIIPVSEHEAKYGLGCNLVSTGETVIMSDEAPQLAARLIGHHLKVIRLPNQELRKSGGGFRCISLGLYS